MQATQAQQRIGVRGTDLGELTQLPHHTDQGIEFDGFTRFDILQHRCFEGAQFARDRVSVFRRLHNGDADLLANELGLQHDLGHKIAHQVVLHDQVGGGTCERTDGVDRHVAPQLVPNIFLNLRRCAGVESSGLQIGHQLLHTQTHAALLLCRFAQYQALAKMMAHHTWRIQRATGVHHTTHHMLAWNGAANLAIRVDGFETSALECATKAVKKPPGHTVHGRHHHGVGGQQWRYVVGNIAHAWGLHSHNHQVLRT